MKKTILVMSLFSVLNVAQADSNTDYDLANKLIEENHSLKLKTNDLEMKYRSALLDSQKAESAIKDSEEKISALIQQNKSITQKYNNALVKSAQYDAMTSKIKALSNQVLQINKSLLDLISETPPSVQLAPKLSSTPPEKISYSKVDEKPVSSKNMNINSELTDSEKTSETNELDKYKNKSEYIEPFSGRKVVKLKKDIVAVFVNDIGNIRKGPSPKTPIVKQTKKGDFVLLTYKEQYGNWFKIKDKQEWVYKTLVRMN